MDKKIEPRTYSFMWFSGITPSYGNVITGIGHMATG